MELVSFFSIIWLQFYFFDMVILYSQETPMWNLGQFRNSIGCWLSKLPSVFVLFSASFIPIFWALRHTVRNKLFKALIYWSFTWHRKIGERRAIKPGRTKHGWRFSIKISFMRRLAKRDNQQWAMALDTRKELKDDFHSFIVEEVYVNGHWRKRHFKRM